MKSFFYFFAAIVFIFFSGCNENREKIKNASNPPKSKETTQSVAVNIKEAKPVKYRLVDIDNNEQNITTLHKTITFHNIRKPLILIHFTSTWSPPSRAQLPILSKLQKKYSKNLFVLGILVDDKQESAKFRYFMKKFNANFFISNSKDNTSLTSFIIKSLDLSDNFPIPLSVLYINGEFYRFYEGAMPIEMMDYEIREAIKSL